MSAISGVLLVNILYFTISAAGVGASLAAAPTVFLVIKYVGAGYLVWMAWEILRDLKASSIHQANTQQPSRNESLAKAFFKGIIIQASNVKNIPIFVAIIPEFINPADPAVPQFVGLGLVSIAVELPVLVGYCLLAARLSKAIKSRGYSSYLDATSAIVLIGIAGSLVLFA
jgi:homoserine/homoserine lactone efflux protein